MKMYRELIERKYYKNGSQTFNASSQFQTFTVPATVTKLNIDCVASKGADSSTATGGSGGRIKCTLPITPSSSLYIYVGDIPSSFTTAEYNASDIRTDNTGVTDNTSLSSRLVVAGGGGSAGSYTSTPILTGGSGGGEIGGKGTGRTSASGGNGGTQTSGGSAPSSAATAGSFGLGANGSSSGSVGVGAGGAGWYGGSNSGKASNGATNAGGGGGGSSYADSSCYKVEHTQGYNAGAGYITITYVEEGTSSDYDFYKDIYQYKAKSEPYAFYAAKSWEKGQYLSSVTGVDYTVSGSPIVEEGIAGNFNANSYLKLTPYIPSGDFELQVAFTLPNPLVDNSYVIEFPNMFSLGFSSGNTSQMIGWNWSSSSFVTIIPSPNVVAGSYYKVKVQRTSEGITTSWSKDGGDFSTPQLYVASATQTSYGVFGNAVTNTASRYFRGTIDLENTYIKSNGFLWFIPQLNHLAKPEIIGTPTISNGIVSNFTSSSYVSMSEGFNPGSNTWESVTKVKVNSFTNKNTIISYQFSGTKSYQVSINNGGNAGKLVFYASSDGSNTDIANNMMSSTAVLTTGTWYWVRVKFTGSAYEVAYSTDGENFTTCITVNSSTVIRQNTQNSYGFNFSTYPEVLDGEIDLKETYVKINGHYWFSTYTQIEPPAIVKATVVGSPTIVDGVASGFSGSDYLTTGTIGDFGSNSWTLKTRIYIDQTSGAFNKGIVSFAPYVVNGGISFRDGNNITFYGNFGDSNSNTGSGQKINITYSFSVGWYDISLNYNNLNGKYTLNVYDTSNNLLASGNYTTSVATKSLLPITSNPSSAITWGSPNGGFSTSINSIDFNNTYIRISGYYFFNGQIEES